MRRLLLIAVTIALLVGTCAGVASARFADPVAQRAQVAAPFLAPAAEPREDVAQPGAYGFRTSGAIARDITGVADASPAAQPAGGTGASVTVTATVLPVVFVVVDGRSGQVESLTTNTEQRDAASVLYLVRADATDGEHRRMDASTWKGARRALARTHAGTGTVWSR